MKHYSTSNRSIQQFISTLHCIQPTEGHVAAICGGRLRIRTESLLCERCKHEYPIVQNVPVLKVKNDEKDIEWFEEIYNERSRTKDIASTYLREERDVVARLCDEWRIIGPSLEVGCGVGMFAELVPGYVGLEYSLAALLADGFESHSRVCSSATTLPFADASMQLLLSFNTYEHIPELDVAFAEMDRICKPGGLLILRPAWHCAQYVTELIHILPYYELSVSKKIKKALLPVLTSRAFKFLRHVPWRLWRRLTADQPSDLRWRRLTPYHGPLWEADTDATSSIDCHETILYFTSRGYECLSHRGPLKQLLAGHNIVTLRKPSN